MFYKKINILRYLSTIQVTVIPVRVSILSFINFINKNGKSECFGHLGMVTTAIKTQD
jgi:hypothetical protein